LARALTTQHREVVGQDRRSWTVRRENVPSLGFAGSTIVAATVATLAPSAEASTIPLVVMAVASIVAMIVGVAWHRPERPIPWLLIIAANCLSTAGGLLTATMGGKYPHVPLVPHLVMFCSYPLVAAAAVYWLRTSSVNTVRTVAIDTALVGLGALITTWVLLFAPAVADRAPLQDPRFVTGAHLLVDALVLAIVTHVAYTSARGNRSFVLVYFAVTAVALADVVYALSAVHVDSPIVGPFFGALCLSYGAFGAAALHPGMGSIAGASGVAPDRFRQRFVEVTAVCLLGAAIIAVRPPFGIADQLVRAGILVALLAGVLIRSERAVRTIAQKESEARQLATHDELTGLSNRAWLYASHHAAVLVGDGQPLSLLFMDLDDFKLVNDSYGHRTGDELIVAAANRLSTIVADRGIVHRLGGDEFVVTTRLDPAGTDALARLILRAFGKPFTLSQVRVTVSISIGIATTPSHDTLFDLDDLIREADSAMYYAKSQGSGSYALFDDKLREIAVQKLQVTSALRDALDYDEFELYFQPIVEVGTGSTAAFEALIRWHHEGVVRGPDYFLAIAESSDIMIDIGQWVLHTACAQLRRHWQNTDERPAVSVNVSARQLRDPRFFDEVVSTLAAHDVPPSALWLELTETALIDDDNVALKILNALSDSGVTICLDDFGIGYSALSNLNKYPIDIVKIDKSFIATLGADEPYSEKHRVLVNSIEAMSSALGLATVAEGVETPEHEDQVRTIGCRYAQGWNYGVPAPNLSVRASNVYSREAG
jgi:diguanylate cyclase